MASNKKHDDSVPEIATVEIETAAGTFDKVDSRKTSKQKQR